MPPAVFSQVLDEIGMPREGLEQIQNYKEAIFWSFSRKDYQKTNWWPKTASAAISRKLTIRTANTVRKLDWNVTSSPLPIRTNSNLSRYQLIIRSDTLYECL